ncbi:MAG: hypothetical protein ABSF70_10435 [Terracidiphilus sp.]|jgi:hypothetical protein
MSEYQYYDFKAIDRALTKTEMAALRSISTRAVITSTSFTNHYEWGDLKADPLNLLEKYFDAFVYIANWGTREFHLRLPQELVDAKQIKAMFPGKSAQVRSSAKFVTLSFESEVEPDDDWDDGTGWMVSLIPLRGDLLRRDFRCLYLGWLFSVQNGEFSDEVLEPPVPAGLRELSAPYDSLIEFLGIDEDLVEVAASASGPLKAGQSRKDLTTWIRGLTEKEKDGLLVNALSEPDERWRIELLCRFEHENASVSDHGTADRRSIADLLTASHARAEERMRKLNAQRAAEAARKKAKEEANRVLYLDNLAKREKAVWKQVDAHIQKRQPNDYDRAVILLTDLHDLAVRQGGEDEFLLTMEELHKAHAAKDSFLRRLTKAKL